jgi:uncharacterized protein (DUF1800 family)
MLHPKPKSNGISTALSVRYAFLLFICCLILAGNADTAAAASRELHVLNRLAFGPRLGDIQRIRSMGVDQYIQEQLSPDSIPLPEPLTAKLQALETLSLTSPQLFLDYGPPSYGLEKGDKTAAQRGRQRARIIVDQAIDARLSRAIESPRQLNEVVVNFWFSHFNLFSQKGFTHLWVGSYEEQAIRPYALGRFRDLLGATAKHPAMLYYLDNWRNTAPNSPGARGSLKGLNENYARELMELHTLGVDGGTRRTMLSHWQRS